MRFDSSSFGNEPAADFKKTSREVPSTQQNFFGSLQQTVACDTEMCSTLDKISVLTQRIRHK